MLQLGGAARLSVDAGRTATVVDFIYASGDQNPYDKNQNAFVADPGYEVGLLLFRQVLAAQTARSVGTASDPQLVGAPASDVERLATRGGVTNTVAIFPRLLMRPITALEVYSGPLVAFANVPATDVFNTEISGGAPHGSLGARASRSLGVEVDIGARYRALLYGSELTAGVEAGVLSPSSAFLRTDGTTMGRVYGARGIFALRL